MDGGWAASQAFNVGDTILDSNGNVELCTTAGITKHKHFFAPGYETCQCGAARCDFRISGHRSCKKVATASGLCRRHSAEAETEKESKRGFWTAARITEILKNSDQTTTLEGGRIVRNSLIIYRFLQRMFERQTQDEQANFSTSHDNGIGFAGCDARLLSDMATHSKQYNDTHPNAGLTPRQAKYAASRLTKYVKTQLVVIANEATEAPMAEAETIETVKAALRRPELLHQPELPLEPETFRHERVGAMGEQVREALMNPIDAAIAELKASNPAKYLDPFEEGEQLTEEAAREFWTKRFSA